MGLTKLKYNPDVSQSTVQFFEIMEEDFGYNKTH